MFLREMGPTNIVILAILSMVGSWAIIFTLISRVGGWATLAEQYRCEETFTGPRWSFQRGQMRWMVGYNNCLNVGADPRGLYLSILFPFRLGHPPLFIPWRDISYSSKKVLWVKFVELRLGREVTIPFRISNQLAEKLKTAAGTSWPIENVA
jgi:hypothetical protein